VLPVLTRLRSVAHQEKGKDIALENATSLNRVKAGAGAKHSTAKSATRSLRFMPTGRPSIVPGNAGQKGILPTKKIALFAASRLSHGIGAKELAVESVTVSGGRSI
jgi:hypothetical protein